MLVKSRRRCCICFGLFRNTSLRLGQIAHLDHDPANADPDNLAFLCFEHHDAYDGSTAQSKGLLAGEVKFYRDELYRFVGQWVGAAVRLDEITTQADPIAGKYVRVDANASAELSIERVAGGQLSYKVSGTALWGTRRGAPHIGTLDFVADLKGDRLEHREVLSGDLFRITLLFSDRGLRIEEDGRNPYAGMNVRFGGDYRRDDQTRVSAS